ncbi:ABC transporter permease [Ornithinibacillus scapharcae]|uniref:ABC transporter permease n=1 Tax=Ornithinibacillus scapharcae TaxID=1147159 RepID=UPI0004929C47|nr:ABC transporter permease [Ornithinibacillus scapharcae]
MTVLIIIISTVSYTFSSLSTANEQVERDITNFSRGSYDILIRPPEARTELEKQLNVIEENYLGVGNGGITIGEWEGIKSHPQVEIAAPIASIGLFTAIERTWMIERKENLKYYEVEYYTSDGVNSYKYDEDAYMYDFSPSIRYPSSFEVANNFFSEDIAAFYFPTSYHQVVAVDVEEEGKLTNYDLSLLEEQVESKWIYSVDQDVAIPIVSLKGVPVPNTIHLTLDNLEVATESEVMDWNSHFINDNPLQAVHQYPEEYHKVIDEYVSRKRKHNEEKFVFKPEDGPSPFEHLHLYVDDNGKLAPDDGTGENMLGGSSIKFSQNIGYQLNPVLYEIIDATNLAVKQIGKDNAYHVPLYRDIQEVEFFELDEAREPINRDDAFEFYNVGFFSIKENTEELASAPLGIYGSDMPYLKSEPTIKLHPSAVPGSFVTTPAHGLISLKWAEKIKGNAPIDAIRVKVSGITGYDKKAAELIEELANEWKDKGYTVDIVAGASLHDITVDVEGIGKVVQPFTTLGASGTVVLSWNLLQVVLTIFYGLIAITFVTFTFFNLLSDRKSDELLLGKLGWSEKLIRKSRYNEWCWLLGLPIFITLVGYTVFGMVEGNWGYLLLAGSFSGVLILLFVWADLLVRRNSKQLNGQKFTITLQNIWFYRNSLLASCIQLLLITILTCFLPFFLIQNVERTTQTRLGSYIHGEIEGLFIVITVLLYVLSIVTVYQSLRRMWIKRLSEIQLFLYLGWGKKAIRNYFVKEVLLWAGITIFIGWLISLLISVMFMGIAGTTVLWQTGGFLLIFSVTLGSSIYTLNRVNVKEGGRIAIKA